MNTARRNLRLTTLIALGLFALATGCTTTSKKTTSGEYEDATASSESYRCPMGHVLTCETKRTGRIRFGKMGKQNLESCACEPETGVPVNSPLPGIY